MPERILEIWQAAAQLTGTHPALLVGLYVTLHVVCAALFLPCSPFTLIAGSLWGIFPGLIISFGAACAAMTVTFALGRWARSLSFVRHFLKRRLAGRRLALLDDPARLDWMTVLALQMNPIVPASSFGYLFGASGVSFWRFIAASAVATAPMQIVLVATSAVVLDALSAREVTLYTTLVLGGASITLAAWTILRRRWRNSRQRDDGQHADGNSIR